MTYILGKWVFKTTCRAKKILAEGTNESKKKDDIPSKDEILPIQGEPNNNVDLSSLRP